MEREVHLKGTLNILFRWFGAVLPMAAVVCAGGSGWAADFPGKVKKPIDASISLRQKTQKGEDAWADERAKLEAEYERLLSENERRAAERDALRKRVGAHEAVVAVLENEIREVSRVSEELTPFLEEVYGRLEALIDGDAPFLLEERRRRLENLRRILDDPLASPGETFRRVMEALFVEAEYGATVEVHQGKIDLEGRAILVNIFRLGRISLFFQTLDKTITGCFDPARSAWKTLPTQYRREIGEAMEMGAKRRPVELLSMPLGRIVTP